MDGKQFAYYLMRHPHLAAAVKHLVVAEADRERDGKHFPYREAGGTAEDEAIAEAITETAELVARKEALAREHAERASLLPGETEPDPRRVAELEATREDEVAASDFPTGPEDAEARERARVRREGRRHD